MKQSRHASTLSTTAARLTFCDTHKIRYNQQNVHRTLLLAALKYTEVVSERTHRQIMRLERAWGRETLSGKWNNLNRLLQLCSKEAEASARRWNGQTASDLVSHVIEYVEWWLKNGRLDARGLGSCCKDEVRCFDARPD